MKWIKCDRALKLDIYITAAHSSDRNLIKRSDGSILHWGYSYNKKTGEVFRVNTETVSLSGIFDVIPDGYYTTKFTIYGGNNSLLWIVPTNLKPVTRINHGSTTINKLMGIGIDMQKDDEITSADITDIRTKLIVDAPPYQ